MAELVRTLATVTERIRRRCDQENSSFVSNTELYEEINGSYADLFDAIHDSADTHGFLTSADSVTVAGTDVYTLTSVYSPGGDDPDQTDGYRVAGIDIEWEGKWRSIGKINFSARNRLVDETGWSGPERVFYRLHNHVRNSGALQVRFFPVPQAVHNFRIWYMPIAPELTTTMPVVALNGWDEFIVADVCSKVLEKEESDTRPFAIRRDRALQRIVWAAANLDDSGVDGIREVIDWGSPSRRGSEEHSDG